MITFKQIIKTIKDNINYAKIGLGVNIYDPWFKSKVEEELNKRNIKYISGYEPHDKFYEYAIIGGEQKDVNDFVVWLKTFCSWKYYITKHAIFRTPITVFVIK